MFYKKNYDSDKNRMESRKYRKLDNKEYYLAKVGKNI